MADSMWWGNKTEGRSQYYKCLFTDPAHCKPISALSNPRILARINPRRLVAIGGGNCLWVRKRKRGTKANGQEVRESEKRRTAVERTNTM